jgi:hypothetical protein
MTDLVERLRLHAFGDHSIFDEAAAALEAAYRCIIDGTRAFCPPIEDGADIRRWFDEHDATIQSVIAWKDAQKQTSVSKSEGTEK